MKECQTTIEETSTGRWWLDCDCGYSGMFNSEDDAQKALEAHKDEPQ